MGTQRVCNHTSQVSNINMQNYGATLNLKKVLNMTEMLDWVKNNKGRLFHHIMCSTDQAHQSFIVEFYHHVDGLAQDCSNSSALAMELLQFCTKPSIWSYSYYSRSPHCKCLHSQWQHSYHNMCIICINQFVEIWIWKYRIFYGNLNDR